MNTIDFIKLSLNMSGQWIMGLAADAKDVALTPPTPKGGNHPLWCLGHLVYSEGNLIHQFAKGGENPVAEWEGIFGQGTQPTTNASDYPSYDDVLAKAEEIRAATLAYLDTLTDAELDKPSHVPEEMAEMRQWFGTIGQCFAGVPVHFGFHGGQIADGRRAGGKPIMMG